MSKAPTFIQQVLFDDTLLTLMLSSGEEFANDICRQIELSVAENGSLPTEDLRQVVASLEEIIFFPGFMEKHPSRWLRLNQAKETLRKTLNEKTVREMANSVVLEGNKN